jgi:RNA polymerase sigma factor (sigma-70 family)
VSNDMTADVRRTIEAVWRIDGARVVGTLARMVGDVGLAEDLAQDALTDALKQWPESGVPRNAGAWLTAVGKRKAIDGWRRRDRLDERYRTLAHELETSSEDTWEPISDDVLKLVFTACHPVLGRPAQVALTLRIVGGLTTEEIARMFLVPVPTMQQRIVRAKKTLTAARVPFEVPEPAEWKERLAGVLAVVYLIFTEGYAATSGDRWIRADLAAEALRLGRMVTALVPREPEPLGLVALMELQASRFAARIGPGGDPVLLADQDRRRWDHGQIARGLGALERADGLGRGRGPYALQAAIAACHATAPSVGATDWDQIVTLYQALERLSDSPIIALNKAVAVSMAAGAEVALRVVDEQVDHDRLRESYLLPSVRGELLIRLGRVDEARTELRRAADLAGNDRQRDVLLAKLEGLSPTPRP